jgi:hypothetical protein
MRRRAPKEKAPQKRGQAQGLDQATILRTTTTTGGQS